MSEFDPAVLKVMIDTQRELGGINQHLANLDGKVSETLAQAKATNGRVTDHDRELAVVVDRQERIEKKFEESESRPRVMALGIGGPVIAALAGVLLAHAF